MCLQTQGGLLMICFNNINGKLTLSAGYNKELIIFCVSPTVYPDVLYHKRITTVRF